ncbi:Phytanoyl-CoA dioxygenase (PhyH) [Dyella jiangningensis]|uniref:phytanoyl-CoA dioxygenase family protein n=1 Tax=Dyella sp. AtDHG13 TaxID=1938897 RepID=UPI0008900095|nr:phytanoyl-CoA dioxygenase family protein [Dyella sp. AtDHG13]PXV52307.1 phytanoyl-CoA dioxygenase PhyH [Dyella sp. AtDHG13]SDK15654.1 Phytanoyl-CoA dioxygenase (PhyH) [Dyella jiangningensis]
MTQPHTPLLVLSDAERTFFREQGYLIRKILDDVSVARYVAAVDEARRESGEAQRMSNLQFLQPGKAIRGIQDIICNEDILAVCRDLLGEGIIVDGASLFYADAGVDYRQGWHRDVLQVPDDQVDTRWFSEDYHYNYVQMNMPLTADGCLWIVPGSHRRQLDAQERAIFGNTEKMAPVEAPELSTGKQIVLQPGEAVFYNNYAVHRGWGGVLKDRRITIHLGFHSAQYPPTLHFGVLDHTEYSVEYLSSLAPCVREALRAHLVERARHPEVNVFHAYHQQFLKQEFKTT